MRESGIHDWKKKKTADDGISKTLKPDISGQRLFKLSLFPRFARISILVARQKAVMH